MQVSTVSYCTWTSKSHCNMLCTWRVSAKRKSSLISALENTLKEKKKEIRKHLPFYKDCKMLFQWHLVTNSAWSGPLGGGVFLLASWPLVSAWESIWTGRVLGSGLFISHFIFLGFFFALACIISCLHLVWTAVAGVREVASPGTFRESGALYVTQTWI